MSPTLFYLAHVAVIAYALIGGVFLAFSDFIMRALSLTSGHGGAEAMQTINREVFRWLFMALFLGLAGVSIALMLCATVGLTGPTAPLVGTAGLAYFIGCFGVTVLFNVPLNEALASIDVSKDATRDYWLDTYVPRWTFWNSVRTLACGLAAALLLLALTSVAQVRFH